VREQEEELSRDFHAIVSSSEAEQVHSESNLVLVSRRVTHGLGPVGVAAGIMSGIAAEHWVLVSQQQYQRHIVMRGLASMSGCELGTAGSGHD
jgi:hypothetical protein